MSNKNNVGRIPETGAMTAYERWELPSLDDKDEAANEIEIEPVTAEEVEGIRQEAYQDGLTQGQEKGYQEGLAKGQKEGHAQGLKLGEDEGTKQGYDKGLKQGLAEGQKDIAAEVKNLADLMARFDQPLADLNSQVQESLLNVITAVSRTVIHRELQTDSSQVTELLKQGLDQMESSREQIEVTVNPVDLIHVENAAEEAGATWKIVGDDSILPGGLKLKSGPSLVDLTSEHRFQQAILNLLGRTDWAIDLAADKASDTQKTLSSLAEGYDLPDDSQSPDSSQFPDESQSKQAPEQAMPEMVDHESDDNESADNENTEQGALNPDETEQPSEQLLEESDTSLDETDAAVSSDSVDERVEEPVDESVEEPVSDISETPQDLENHSEEQSAESSSAETLVDTEAAESSDHEQASAQQEEVQDETAVEENTSEFTAFEETVVNETDPQAPQESLDGTTPTSEEPMLGASDDEELGNGSLPELESEGIEKADDSEVFDFDAASQDEHTTVYPENQKVSDLMAQEDFSEQDVEDINQTAPQELPDLDNSNGAMSDPSSQQSAAAPDSDHPEVKSMMQPTSQGNGFEAFAWQTPQAQQAQAHAQAMNQQAQQAQMQAQAATAQAQHAQMQAQQAQAQAQAMNQQAQAQMQYQPQYAPQQGMPQQGMGQPGMPMQGYPQQSMQHMQPSMQTPMQGGMMPMPQNMQQGMQPGMASGQWGSYQGMPVQPVPLIPAQQGNFSAFSYSAPSYFNQNPQAQNQGMAQSQNGFVSYPYPVI